MSNAFEITPELLAGFLDEAPAYLATLEEGLLALENRARDGKLALRDPSDEQRMTEVFRAAHSLKGISASMGLTQIRDITHLMESIFDQLRSHARHLNAPEVQQIFAVVDCLRSLIASLAEPAAAPLPIDASILALRVILAASPHELGTTSPQVRMPPQVMPADPRPSVVSEPPRAGSILRVESQRIDHLASLGDELVAAHARLGQLAGKLAEQLVPAAGVPIGDRSEFTTALDGIGRLADELRRCIAQARLSPIGPMLQRFRRIVRDLSRSTAKDVVLVLKGESIELERNLIDELVDPLMHIIRNCIDHGIESADVRTRAGKPPAGTIEIRASERENCLYVEVEDDGRGIDLNAVRRRIAERCLASPEQVGRLSESEAIGHIFRPGFSTAPRVTEISGRGVGMDIVKTKIEALGGEVTVQSVPGRGTTIILTLPRPNPDEATEP